MIELGEFHVELRQVTPTNTVPLVRRTIGITSRGGFVTLCVTDPDEDVAVVAHLEMAEQDRLIAELSRAREMCRRALEDRRALENASRKAGEGK